jgi:hypothetical protein
METSLRRMTLYKPAWGNVDSTECEPSQRSSKRVSIRVGTRRDSAGHRIQASSVQVTITDAGARA